MRAITVTAATNTKTYDGTILATATPAITSGNLAAGDTAALTETYDTANVGTGKTLTPAGSVSDGNGGNNYTVAFAANTTGAITARTDTAYVNLSNAIGNGFNGSQGGYVQIPIRVDNLQDGTGNVGMHSAQVTLDYGVTQTVSSISETGTTVTVATTAPHGFVAGESVTVAGFTGSGGGFNSVQGGNFNEFIIASVPTATTFTYTDSTKNLGTAAGNTGTKATASFFNVGRGQQQSRPQRNRSQRRPGPLVTTNKGWAFITSIGGIAGGTRSPGTITISAAGPGRPATSRPPTPPTAAQRPTATSWPTFPSMSHPVLPPTSDRATLSPSSMDRTRPTCWRTITITPATRWIPTRMRP